MAARLSVRGVEAGTGIEPVFTDLQSGLLVSDFNGLGYNSYQDKSSTSGEPDTLNESVENENPGALAGATGADKLWESFTTEEYRNRALAATALCAAIAECERDDVLAIMEAALLSMRAGAPDPVFAFVMQEANEWAAFASKAERKAYALASFNRLSAPDRAAFLDYVKRGAA
ncbi:hypothetical protein [Tabrizicola sp.]|uniref:hypothetical protein n=1 Tax=Tabrizicola sp. TaxID=2005166 RepID=UPI001A442553|nr:hypothetical protein [Tabrizicola sp.]MBL9061712.1 hypothetical protein [Tabrizicola sp.]